MASSLQRIELRQQPLHSLANLVALCAQGIQFLHQAFSFAFLVLCELRLLGRPGLRKSGTFFCGGPCEPLALDQVHGAQDALFKGRKLIRAERHSAQLLGGRLRLMFFNNLGTPGKFRHEKTSGYPLDCSIAPEWELQSSRAEAGTHLGNRFN
jgi:hypothetical protein